MDHATYESPLNSRYASKEMSEVFKNTSWRFVCDDSKIDIQLRNFTLSPMSFNFSDHKKFSTWRRLWVSLAKAEKALGLDISDEQIKEMEYHVESIDFAKAAIIEKVTRHDVMAHVHVFAEQCPKAAPIIHLGATSCFVGDNTDLIVLRDGLDILLPKVFKCIKNLSKLFDVKPDTGDLSQRGAGSIAVLNVMSDLLADYDRMEHLRQSMRFRGVKGTTGTQASFLSLFDGDYAKVKQLDELVTEMNKFERSLTICGQTYSRRTDIAISSCLSGICDTVYKICSEIQNLDEDGASVLAYKCCSLAKLTMSHLSVFLNTLSVQWMERTLDDSACRRVSLAESFLCIDKMLDRFFDLTQDSGNLKKVLSQDVKEDHREQELQQYKKALDILSEKLARCIDRLSKFALAYKGLPTLGYTHLQAAQLTTVGKRACLWLSDLLADLQDIEQLKTLSDKSKVDKLNDPTTELRKVASVPTMRKQCTAIASCLATISASVHKICTDIRILAHEKEIEEPFEITQIGSSAMAYKRNPMRCERCCSLARLPMANLLELLNAYETDVARVTLERSFLCVDGILNILQNVVSNLRVYDQVIKRHIQEELPFMATENIIMGMVKAGGNRQDCHEEIRVLSQEAAKVVKLEGKSNDLLDRIRSSSYFAPIHDKLDELLNPSQFIGCCVPQVEQFIDKEVAVVLKRYEDCLDKEVELYV